MIEVVTWANSHVFGDSLAAHHRLRHKCFVERNGWSVPSHDGMEYDQFDTPAATYLIHRHPGGQVNGVARLIPTTRPYMLKELWPDLLGDDVPVSSQVWEATRFGIDDDLDPTVKRRVAAEIVLGCLEFGLSMGIDRYLVLMPHLIIRRTIGGAGCKFRFLGESRTLTDYPVAAAEIEVSEQALASARAKCAISGSVLRRHDHAAEAA
ncbi:acyl-homoserine-lactone synthase [Magnetospirillum sp. 64-120]|uniref:acyl-homoserine-lactone synthase n=1 Tax=Magnetospirillum sp. 64-120 TaxID=1895778 RepID=UPI0025C3D41D|nr:acyl-homoserine-lactone synthase [Magnetospirillum sp. 64-120]